MSAFTRVFDAIWAGVSKDGDNLPCSPSFEMALSRLLRMRSERLAWQPPRRDAMSRPVPP